MMTTRVWYSYSEVSKHTSGKNLPRPISHSPKTGVLGERPPAPASLTQARNGVISGLHQLRLNIRVADRAGEPKSYVFSDMWNILSKITIFLQFLFTRAQNVALECFSEAESASIRSAAKFCFDLYVQKNFQLFQKIFFWSIKKIFLAILRFFFQKIFHKFLSKICRKKISKMFEIFEPFLRFFRQISDKIFWKNSGIFGNFRKYFRKKV